MGGVGHGSDLVGRSSVVAKGLLSFGEVGWLVVGIGQDGTLEDGFYGSFGDSVREFLLQSFSVGITNG